MDYLTGIRTALVIMLATGVASCAGMGTLVKSPTVSLSSVELASASFSRQTFHLGFAVDNPNPFSLPVKAVEYRVYLDNERFAGGETVGDFTVRAHGQDAFTISVDLDFLGSASRLTSLLRGGMPDTVDYELQGRLTIDLPFVQSIPFSSTGVIQVADNSR